ncbi:MAG: helix-turn-helix domain-containing protein [Roseburia sp.]|nr:helix-turn-helix domain-containing protein [Roseburia sp.]
MQMNIGETIKRVRKQKGLSQEDLAEKFGISVQAVSKWECGLSYPDITLLPLIADELGISLDLLLRGSDEIIEKRNTERIDLPDDDTLRIVQCIGQKIVSKEEWEQSKHDQGIPVYFDEQWNQPENPVTVAIEVWGSAEIDGSVSGDVKAENSVMCAEVHGDVQAGGSVNCAKVCGDVRAGNSVNCTQISGEVSAGGNVRN